MKRVLMVALGAAACAGHGLASSSPEPCAADTSVYTFRDTARGVTPPILTHATLPRGGFGKVTAQGIVGKNGRIESGTIRTAGGPGIGERWTAGDMLFWSEFYPAKRQGCSVRFLFRITYVSGIPQETPEEPPDASGRR